MELTDRKKKVLRAIVESYISTAEPVGSKAIASMPDMNFSSATIRNEMADLTAMGYLEQPHTSAGRVPSPAGYRIYIDELMQDYRLSVDETHSLNEAMTNRLQEFDTAISQMGKLISQMTNLPAYAMTSHKGAVTIRQFQLVPAGDGGVILIVMTNTDEIQNKLIRLPNTLTDQDLKLLSAVLNASLTELTADQITPELLNRVSRSAGEAAALVPIIVDFAAQVLRKQARNEIYLTGQAKLLNQPEYQDIGKAQQMLTNLDEEIISNLPALVRPDQPVQILVGPENIAQELKDTSVVMTRFDIGDGMQGMIGVVGPTRMDYAQVTARLSYFAEGLAKMFGKQELPPAQEENKEDS